MVVTPKEIVGFIKSIYKRNADDFCKAIFGLPYDEWCDKRTGNTLKSLGFFEERLPEVNRSLDQKGYVVKRVSTNLLTYDPVESPDFIVKSKGLRGVKQWIDGDLLAGVLAYPAEINIRGVGKKIYVKSKHKAILPEMQSLAKGLENVIEEKVEISVGSW